MPVDRHDRKGTAAPPLFLEDPPDPNCERGGRMRKFRFAGACAPLFFRSLVSDGTGSKVPGRGTLTGA